MLIFLFLATLVLIVFDDNFKNIKFLVFFFFIMFLTLKYLFVMETFHESIDLYVYKHFFDNINNESIIKRYNFEPGYVFLNKFFYNYISEHFFSFYLFFHSLFLLLVFWCFKYKKYHSSYVLLVYFSIILINIQFGLMRQAVALILFFIAINYVGKKSLKFYFFIVLAILFHRTAILLIFMPWILNKFYNIKSIYIGIGVSYAIYFNFFNLDLFELLNTVVSLFDSALSNKLNYYLLNNSEQNQSPLSYTFLLKSVLLVLILQTRKDLLLKSRYGDKQNILFNLSLISSLMFFLFFSVGFISYRVELYFSIFPYLFLLEKSRYKRKYSFTYSEFFVVVLCFISISVRYFIYGNYI